ncbi:MAG: hypothetical protein PHW73_06435 [Atribacterota bacterium]|nr:hypothetical protein [Atribacterota bacterium]
MQRYTLYIVLSIKYGKCARSILVTFRGQPIGPEEFLNQMVEALGLYDR